MIRLHSQYLHVKWGLTAGFPHERVVDGGGGGAPCDCDTGTTGP